MRSAPISACGEFRVGGDRLRGDAPSVVIIVLNWNKLDVTRECLQALGGVDYPNFGIYLVDNGSSEAGAEAFVGAIPRLGVIRSSVNLGFTGGNNLAMRRAFAEGAEYVWLLNNDAVPEAGTLRSLVAAAEADRSIGLVGPVLRRPTEGAEIEAAGAIFDVRGMSVTVTRCEGQAREWQRERPGQVAVFGTAVLIKRALFAAIGGFDERLFAYDEDIDLSIRSSRAGFRNEIDFGSSVFHRERPRGGEGGDRAPAYIDYYMTRNEILLWAKHRGIVGWATVSWWKLHRAMAEIAGAGPGAGRTPHLDAMLAGVWDGLRLAGGAYTRDRRAPAWLWGLLRRGGGRGDVRSGD